MADLEQLWGAIPPDLHAAWSQRAHNLLIEGSPRCDVLRTCAVLPEASTAAAAVASSTMTAPTAAAYSRPSPSGRPLRMPQGVNPWKADESQQVRVLSNGIICVADLLVSLTRVQYSRCRSSCTGSCRQAAAQICSIPLFRTALMGVRSAL